ncbi:hypothetical protein J3F84DRAFT_358750 [Trichoderma pleuroticola]
MGRGKKRRPKNVRDEMSRGGRVMDEILVKEPATGKLRDLFFSVWFVCLVSSRLVVVGFGVFLAPTTGLGSAIRQQIYNAAGVLVLAPAAGGGHPGAGKAPSGLVSCTWARGLLVF